MYRRFDPHLGNPAAVFTPLPDSNAGVARAEPGQPSLPRSLAESLVTLLIAVILFRTFLAEGYMISTGSMAPALLGYHKRVVCPTCHAEFPFGVAFDTDDPEEIEAGTIHRQNAVCPDCGQVGINVADESRNHGDQLLVFKQAFAFRSPRRWEVIVFRNPADPLEAFVKRLVALPGETVQVENGDLRIDGELCRKSWADQRELRIPVHRHRAAPADSSVQPHWTAQPAASDQESTWQPVDDLLAYSGTDSEEIAWVNYAHWIRRGGQHQTVVPLESWPSEIQSQTVPPAGLRYDKQTRRLSCIGAMSESVRDRLIEQCNAEDFQAAVHELFEQSHVTPITDFYGYNSGDQHHSSTTVRDLMWSGRVHVAEGQGEFHVEMSTGVQTFDVVLDFAEKEIRLHVDDAEEPAEVGSLPASLVSGKATVEVSLFDQQVLVAVNGAPVLSPHFFETPANSGATRHPIRFGAQGLSLRVDEIVVYRDVYYTAQPGGHADSEPYRLGDDEFFVLGDNSPVSHDSRRWQHAPVPRRLLVGKPFIVHMPSKPGQLNMAGYEMHLRLPDVERVRLLR